MKWFFLLIDCPNEYLTYFCCQRFNLTTILVTYSILSSNALIIFEIENVYLQ